MAEPSDIRAAQDAYDSALVEFQNTPNPEDPQTPEEWMGFSRYLDARDRLRAAHKRLEDAKRQGSPACES